MIIIAPLVAIITLALFNPDEFGGHPNIQSIFFMYAFAMITVALWITYIPSIILAPIVKRNIQKIVFFQKIQTLYLILSAVIVGAFLGIVILFPVIFLVIEESVRLILGWNLAGGISGAVSLLLIVMFYRLGNSALTKGI